MRSLITITIIVLLATAGLREILKVSKRNCKRIGAPQHQCY